MSTYGQKSTYGHIIKKSFNLMAVKNKLKDVLTELLGEEITPTRLRKATGMGHATSLRILKNPDWYPDKKTTEAICKAFGLQPGDFIYFTQED